MDLPLYAIPDAPVILHSWVAIATAAISAAGAILGNMEKNSEAQRQMEQYGVDMAAIDTQAAMQQEALSSQAAQIQQTTQQRKIQVEQNLEKDQAMASVSAAAAGTAGQSVDVSEIELESSAGRAQGNLDTLSANLFGGLDQASRDINITAEGQKSKITPLDTRGQLLDVFTAGLMGFLAGEGKE